MAQPHLECMAARELKTTIIGKSPIYHSRLSYVPSTHALNPTDYAQALYGSQYPEHKFAVLLSYVRVEKQKLFQNDPIEVRADVIVYTRPNSLSEWKLLFEGHQCREEMESLGWLQNRMQDKLSAITSMLES
jgi:hypothetical protein